MLGKRPPGGGGLVPSKGTLNTLWCNSLESNAGTTIGTAAEGSWAYCSFFTASVRAGTTSKASPTIP